MNIVDPTKIDELFLDIFLHNKGCIENFKNDFSKEIYEICEYMSISFKIYQKFEESPNQTEQYLLLKAHIFSLVEALYTSTKLLISGFLSPSGNLFRIALETLSVSILLANPHDVLIPNKKEPVRRNFFKSYENKEKWTKSHLALNILKTNKSEIGITEQALSLLEEAKTHYNKHSHISFLYIRNNIIDSNRLRFGGGYEKSQHTIFFEELTVRRLFLNKIPDFLEIMYKNA